MSEDNTGSTAPNELEILKARARMMGIQFGNAIGVDALRKKIDDKLGTGSNEEPDETTEEEPAENEQEEPNPLEMAPTTVTVEPVTSPVPEAPLPPKKPKKLSLRQWLVQEQMQLVRCRITNLDPKKANLPGEVITVANEYLGTVRHFVPYGEKTEDGWHVPKCIFTFMKDRKFLNIRTVKDRGSTRERTESNWVSEYSLEVLEPLSESELRDLATAQIAAGSVE